MPNAKISDFSSTLPDYKEVLRALFHQWAENALPGERHDHLMYFRFTKIDFQVHSSSLEGAAEQETSGLPDPPASLGDEGFDNATAELDHDISELPDSPIQSLPLLSAHIGSPVIDPPGQSSSLSNSVTKLAIENVAQAGYLNIYNATAVDVDNQVPQHVKTASESQPGRNANSKRNREEIEQGQGPNEVKQKKRQAVPTREQSSRYATSSTFFIGY